MYDCFAYRIISGSSIINFIMHLKKFINSVYSLSEWQPAGGLTCVIYRAVRDPLLGSEACSLLISVPVGRLGCIYFFVLKLYTEYTPCILRHTENYELIDWDCKRITKWSPLICRITHLKMHEKNATLIRIIIYGKLLLQPKPRNSKRLRKEAKYSPRKDYCSALLNRFRI